MGHMKEVEGMLDTEYNEAEVKELFKAEGKAEECLLHNRITQETPAFIVKCKTFKHEYREYEYITINKYSGGMSRFGLRMTKQKLCW